MMLTKHNGIISVCMHKDSRIILDAVVDVALIDSYLGHSQHILDPHPRRTYIDSKLNLNACLS